MKYLGKEHGRAGTITGNAGFTFLELLITMLVLGILAAIAIASFGDLKQRVNEAMCMRKLRDIELAISSYVIDKGTLPNTLSDLGQGAILDPWGRAIVFVNIANGGTPRKDLAVNNINTDYDLYSKGSDGLTNQLLSDASSADDVLRGANGIFVGLGEKY